MSKIELIINVIDIFQPQQELQLEKEQTQEILTKFEQENRQLLDKCKVRIFKFSLLLLNLQNYMFFKCSKAMDERR